MTVTKDDETVLADLQHELTRLENEQLASHLEFQRDIDVVSAKIRALVRSPDWSQKRNRLADRRARVLKMLLEERSYKEIAAALGSHYATIKNDEWRLKIQGLFPIPVRDSSDFESVRRNHVLRVWSYSSVSRAADVTKFLPDLSPNQVESDLRWLYDNGYVDRTTPTESSRDETKASEETPKEETNERDTPGAPAPAPPREPPRKKRRVGTTSELTTTVEALLRDHPSGEVLLDTTTSGQPSHKHDVLLNLEGSGQTTPDETGHQHAVSKFCVMTNSKHYHEVLLP